MNDEPSETVSGLLYNEWLVPSFGNFAAALIVLPSCYLVFLPINEAFGLVLGIILSLMIWAAMLWSSVRIVVTNSELCVGRAHIPVALLDDGREIDADFRFAERGPALDARAFVRFQAGVKPLVRFRVVDPHDPTPYWLLATRHPAELLQSIQLAKQS